MMLSLNGMPADVDGFAFFLGEKLGMTVDQIQDMDAAEYAGWQSYFKVKNVLEGMGR